MAAIGAFLSGLLALYLAWNGARTILVMSTLLVAVACLIWISISRRRLLEGLVLRPNPLLFRFLVMIFFFLLALSILSFRMRSDLYVRPLEYFVLTSAMAGVVSLEIIFGPTSKKTILAIMIQIIAVGLSLVISQVEVFPGVVGSDPWWHQMFALKILDSFRIPDGYSYSRMPIFHLDVVMSSIAIDTTYRMSALISVSCIQVVVNTLCVFLIGRLAFNEKVGMLAGLMLSVANVEIHMGFWTIPTTLGVTMMMIALWMLLKRRESSSILLGFATILVMMTIILTHPLAAAMMAVVLSVGWITTRFSWKGRSYELKRSFRLEILVLFTIAMVTWWIFSIRSLAELANLIIGGFRMGLFVQAPEPVLRFPAEVSMGEQFFNNMGCFLFFSISLLGSFFALSREHGNPIAATVTLCGMTSLFLPFFSVIGGLNVFNDRWWYVAQLLLSVPLAVSVVIILAELPGKHVRYVLLAATVTAITFFMIMSVSANLDNRTFSQETGVRAALTESEIQAIYETGDSFDLAFGTDRYYTYAMIYLGFEASPIDDQLYSEDFEADASKMILIRLEITNRPFYLYGSSPWLLNYDPYAVLEERGFSNVYDCGSVDGYLWTG